MRRGLNIDLNSTEPLYFPFNRNHCFLTTRRRRRPRRERRARALSTTPPPHARTQHMRRTRTHYTITTHTRTYVWLYHVRALPGTSAPANRARERGTRHIFRLQTLGACTHTHTHTPTARLVVVCGGTTLHATSERASSDNSSTQQRGFTCWWWVARLDYPSGSPVCVCVRCSGKTLGNPVSCRQRVVVVVVAAAGCTFAGRRARTTATRMARAHQRLLSSARSADRLAQFAFGFGSEWL